MSDGQYNAIAHHAVTFSLAVRRCRECARFWAFERGHEVRCPYCTNKALVDAYKRGERAARTIAGLKGALTKAKKRAKAVSP